MAEELKELIEKIQLDGIKAAQEKSLEIESGAKAAADDIIDKARKEASRIIREAEDKISRAENGSKAVIKQAARDTVIALKKEISALLDRIVLNHAHKALSADEMSKVLALLIKNSGVPGSNKIIVGLKKEDIEKVEKSLFAELSHELRKGINVKASPEIKGGFLISYDSGKSYFDFSDKAMAENLAAYLKPKLADIVKDVV